MKRWNLLLNVALIVLAAVLLFRREQQHGEEQTRLQERMEQLQSINDSLSQCNSRLDEKIADYKQKADSLQKLITINDRKIEKITTIRNERLAVIDTLDGNELYSFFAGFDTESAAH
ncbi:MAG: hypothetical protein H6585_10185 [Flavobacteriales bacterium]|nr:hypothetical protein [Flavobacteriales bacterium]